MFVIVFLLCALIFEFPTFTNQTRNTKITYKPTWDSLDSRPLPEWYDEGKFGIFIHWGVFSVPAFTEWFWFFWKGARHPDLVQYMEDNYKPNFSYQDFARDFTAELFNSTEWALLFKEAGARYIVLTSKHHEGYTLWPSKYSFSWNAMDIGPHRDLVGELANSVRKETDLKFGLYHSLFEWFNPLHLDDHRNNFTTTKFVDFKTLPEMYELVNTYKPEIFWSDGQSDLSSDYWKSKDFLAWLYNESPVKDTIVVNDRWGSETLCKHGGFLNCADRYNPGTLQSRKWENAMTIDRLSWGYRRNANADEYLSTQELVKQLVITVSCGGNLLLNIGPTRHGKIPAVFQQRLLDIGKWLSKNGQAIYSTKSWNVCRNDSSDELTWYTTKNSKGVLDLYAIFIEWPQTNSVLLKCLLNYNFDEISFLGNDQRLMWKQTSNGLFVELPNKADISSDWAWSLLIKNVRLIRR